jgi:phosphopantothenoylcysteine decarboxylase / phosphopantothenate---cysteine ligase
MPTWTNEPPPRSGLKDREVPLQGKHLLGRRVALLVTGGIAAIKAPFIARGLRRYGAEVVAFATPEGLRYVAEEALSWATNNPVIAQLTAKAEHLSDDAPFDAYLVAPATYNTINKMALGIADTAVTTALASAIGRMEATGKTAILVAPTMHGTLHNSILTGSLQRLRQLGVTVIPPREAYGKHNIPKTDAIVAEVIRATSTSPLRHHSILVTGGPTPVPIDSVRRITNRFRGRLGIEIARELFLRGADVTLIHGDGAFPVPEELPHVVTRTFDAYREAVLETLAERECRFGVFAAAVADYRPVEVTPGKIPSGAEELVLKLVPTPKIIEEVRTAHPHLHMVTFKYQERISHEDLMLVAKKHLERYEAIVANRGEETGPEGEQIAWLLSQSGESQRVMGKQEIATAISTHLERAIVRASNDPRTRDSLFPQR